MNMYELALDFRTQAERLADLDLPDEVIADTLEGLSGEIETKAQNCVMVARNLEATAEAIKRAEAEMANRRKTIENRIARIKDNVLAGMMVAGIQRIECPYFKLSIRDNPPAVEVYEPGLIPAEFMRQPEPPPPAPDKTAIKEALKAGEEVPGCKLTVGKRLEIR